MRSRCGISAVLFFVLWAVPWTTRAASVGTVRVSVFRQGTSTTRSVGSLIGVWEFKGRTFANQQSNVWTRPFPSGNGLSAIDLRGMAFWRKDPRYAFGAGEEGLATWTGTTWNFSAARDTAGTEIHPIGIASSSFAVVGQESEDLWRWSGTSWLHDIDGTNGTHRFRNVSVLSTNFAWAFAMTNTTTIPNRTVLSWRGTTWKVDLEQNQDSYGIGAMISTDFGWYFGRASAVAIPNVYQWAGTSWQIHSQLNWGDTDLVVIGTVPYERDFAIVSGDAAHLWRWMGTSWLYEKFDSANYNDIAVVQTDCAWVVGSSGKVWKWVGTSWIKEGPLTTSNLLGIDAVRTDFAVLTGASGHVWFWRGTSWVRTPTSETETIQSANKPATMGDTATFVACNARNLLMRHMENVIDDGVGSGSPGTSTWSGTLYREVVQILPTDSDWDWAGGSSDTDSYYGVLDSEGKVFDFDKEDTDANSTRKIVIPVSKFGATRATDTFIWEDTVGLWDGHSENPHNLNADTGIRLIEAGHVHTDSGGAPAADVWGESDGRHTSAQRVDGGSTWEEGTASDVTVTANTGWLTWENWHWFDAGHGEGDKIEKAIHVKATGASTTLDGISWKYRVGNYRPRTGNWRWCKDDAAEPLIVKEPRGRLTNVGATGERLRLRARIDETDGGWMASQTGSSGWTLWYATTPSADPSVWTQVTTASSVWKLIDGQATAGGNITVSCMPEVDTLGINVESDTASNGFRQESFTEVEMDFAIESSAASTNTVYFFEARNNGHRALPTPGVGYPSVQTTDETTYNYQYSRAELGPFSRPMVNPAVASGGNGDPFKVIYVGTQKGAGDQLFAISRTNGGLVRSYSASGTLEHGNLYWDSTNARYNLFFRQGNDAILALKDDGGTITTNASWSSNPLSFTNLIGRPTRFFDGDRQNYMMLLVTSFQGNTSTLYKVRGADGSIMTDGEYSKNSPDGWSRGLRTAKNMYPLWIDGKTYALGHNAGVGVVKLSNGAGSTSTVIHESDGGDSTIGTQAVFSPTYTRTTITTGGRLLFVHNAIFINGAAISNIETALRVNDADMTGVEWNTLAAVGSSEDITNSDGMQSSPFSPPFQSAFPVPVYVGTTTAINRLSGSTGVNENSYPYTLTGSVSTEIMIKGDWIYFGTDGGYIYALSATDPTQGAGTRFRVTNDSDIVGVAIDSTNSLVYYTTADGRIYQFDTR